MSKSAPDFVVRMGIAADEWIERDDRLVSENQSLAFNERNQQDWWEQNRKIRALLTQVENLVRSKIRQGVRPSPRLVSWSQLARTLACDRATLKHQRRYQWVNTRRTQILISIKQFEQQILQSDEVVDTTISEVEQLRTSLSAQRTQTAIWYDKCINLEREVSQLTRLLDIRNAKIKSLLLEKDARSQQIEN